MEQYISLNAIVAEIKRLREEEYPCDTFEESTGYYNALDEVSSFLNTLEVEEIKTPVIPTHSYFETIYHCGSEPRWKVGDILAVYEFYRDYEGEEVFGKVIDVYKDEEYDDWVYVFEGEGGGALCECELVSDEAYKKN